MKHRSKIPTKMCFPYGPKFCLTNLQEFFHLFKNPNYDVLTLRSEILFLQFYSSIGYIDNKSSMLMHRVICQIYFNDAYNELMKHILDFITHKLFK